MVSHSKVGVLGCLGLLVPILALSGCAVPSDDPPASVSVDTPVAPLAERMIACMQESGWEASMDWDGTIIGSEMTKELSDQWIDASLVCGEETGFHDGELNDEQVKALYKQETTEAECLRGLGYEIEQPPSLQTYIDTHASADQYYAHASLDVAAIGQGEMREAYAACPPPTLFLNLPGL